MTDTEQVSICRNRKEKNSKRQMEIFKKMLIEILAENKRNYKVLQENTDDVDERRAYFSLKLNIIDKFYNLNNIYKQPDFCRIIRFK